MTDLSEKIFSQYDRLNTGWKLAEEKLAKLHTPLYVQHVFLKTGRMEEALSWRCYRQAWRLAYEWRYIGDENTPTSPTIEKDGIEWYDRPILDCGAEVRVAAAPHFNALYQKVKVAAADWLSDVKDAADKLSSDINIS